MASSEIGTSVEPYATWMASDGKLGLGHQRSAAGNFVGPQVEGSCFHGRHSCLSETAPKLAMGSLGGASIVFVLTNLTDGLH